MTTVRIGFTFSELEELKDLLRKSAEGKHKKV